MVVQHLFLLTSIVLTFSLPTSCLSLRDQEPLGIHIVYGIEPAHQVNIIWWTKAKTVSAIVYYGLLDAEHDEVPIESLSCKHNKFAKGYLARNATNGKFIQRVLLDNLEPNRRYCYEITSGDASSHIYAFRTASYSNLIELKSEDTNNKHSSFLVYGSDIAPTLTTQNNQIDDLQSMRNHLSNMLATFKDEILNKQVNGFVNLPTVHLKEYSEATTVNSQDFLDYYTSVLSNVQILPTLSQMGDSISRNLFQGMFPLKGSVPFNSYFYSIDVNGAHFLSYSADLFTIKTKSVDHNGLQFDASAAALLETQINVIEKDLIKANENRHLVPWVIVIASQSLRCLEFSCDTSTNDVFKKRLESIFYKYNVDLILESSSNLYERSFPVLRTAKKYQLNYEIPEMPVYLSLPKYSVGIEKDSIDKWSAFRYQPYVDNTYGLLEIINSTCIKWSYLYSNKTLIDEFSLTKDHAGEFHRIMQSHKEFLDLTKSKENVKHSFKLIALIIVLFSVTGALGYVTVRKRIRQKRLQKINSNYSNLIESEFDT